MKRLDKELKTLISCWLAMIAFATLLLVKFSGSPVVNNWVLAFCTITLVVVTIFYAIQTQRLVEQEKINLDETIRKREIDFIERRMNDFYGPFLEHLINLERNL